MTRMFGLLALLGACAGGQSFTAISAFPVESQNTQYRLEFARGQTADRLVLRKDVTAGGAVYNSGFGLIDPDFDSPLNAFIVAQMMADAATARLCSKGRFQIAPVQPRAAPPLAAYLMTANTWAVTGRCSTARVPLDGF